VSGGELFSLLINIAVGIYFAWYYPRSVRGKLDRMPRIFSLLNKILPPLGYVLIAVSILYGVLHASRLA